MAMEEDLDVLSGSNDDDEQICPLCMELLDETDRNLFPCSCGYQVCLWCLHYIRNTMGNKCPACRQDYEESNFKYKTKPTTTTTKTIQSKKKRDSKESTSKESLANDGSKDLSKDDSKESKDNKEDQTESLKDVRVIQRNLVYVVGIPLKLAKKEILKKYEYFGQYGKIQHIVVNKSNTYSSNWGGPSYTAYITYSKKSEASCAIQGINGQQIDNKYLRASYGTTKYCSYFLKGLKCFNSDCFYLHQFGDERDRFVKDSSKLLYNSNNFNKEAINFSSVNREQHVSNFNKDTSQSNTTKEPRETSDGTWVSVVSGAKPPPAHSGFTSHLSQSTASASNESSSSNTTTNLATNIANVAANLTSITATLTWNSSANPNDRSLFSIPISQCLERYNRSSRLVHLRNISSDKLASMDTVKKMVEWCQVNPNHDSNKDANKSKSPKDSSPKKAESAEAKEDDDKQPKSVDFIPDELTVNDIMSKIRRHTMLIDNLSKQYSNLNHTSSNSVHQNNFNGNLAHFNKDGIGLNYNRDLSGFNNIESYAINVLHSHNPQSYTNNFTNSNPPKEPGKEKEKDKDANRGFEVDRKLELEAFKILQVQLQRNEQFVNHLKLMVE